MCSWFSLFFFFKQKTAYEMRISDWSSDVCASDLATVGRLAAAAGIAVRILTGREKGAARSTLLGEIADGTAKILVGTHALFQDDVKIGRASCRERVCQYV